MKNLNLIHRFLKQSTPSSWIKYALDHQDILLIDHAHCEKKAASTAMALLYRYVERTDLLHKLSRLAREELRHFEQVLTLLEKRGIAYQHLTASRYMKALSAHIRLKEPNRLVDTLILGAIVESRSCERFAALIPHLDEELASFYTRLVNSEARHFEDYLGLAAQYAEGNIDKRIAALLEIENDLILSPDEQFRFHSGVPLS